MELHLKDKVAVITGGSIGIGLAIAEGLANEGTHLLLVARQPERLNAEAERIRQCYGVRALGVSADVAVAKDIEEVVRVVEREFTLVGVVPALDEFADLAAELRNSAHEAAHEHGRLLRSSVSA